MVTAEVKVDPQKVILISELENSFIANNVSSTGAIYQRYVYGQN